jgi:hypothetical protein
MHDSSANVEQGGQLAVVSGDRRSCEVGRKLAPLLYIARRTFHWFLPRRSSDVKTPKKVVLFAG